MKFYKFSRIVPVLMSYALLAACDSSPTARAPDVPVAAADARVAARSLPAAVRTTQARTDADSLRMAIDALLRDQYPAGFDTANRCWRTERGSGDLSSVYCMGPLPHHVVREGDVTSVYIALASASDITGNVDYLYGHADPGAMDAYRLTVGAGGAYTLTAKGLGLTSGTAGDCGCASGNFVRAGARVHGWKFSAGGTWQGVTVASHSLVVPVGDTFKDVAGVPRFREDDQTVEYTMEVDSRRTGDDWYPLRLSLLRDGKPTATRTVAFDRRSASYPTPRDF